jgi:hypothetical protein
MTHLCNPGSGFWTLCEKSKSYHKITKGKRPTCPECRAIRKAERIAEKYRKRVSS